MRTRDSRGFGTRLDESESSHESIKTRIEELDSSKYETHQKGRIRAQNARDVGKDEYSVHKGES